MAKHERHDPSSPAQSQVSSSMRPVRLIDVAQAAGVSRSTASRALTSERGTTEKTRKKVRQVADRLGYIRDRRAANLAGGNACVIGMIVRADASPFYGSIIRSVQDYVDSHHADLLIVIGSADPSRQQRAIDVLLEQRVNGIVIASGRADHDIISKAASKIPISTIGIDSVFTGADSVAIRADSEAQLVDHVLSYGHRHIGVTYAPREHSYTLWLRAERICQAIRSHPDIEVSMIPVDLHYDIPDQHAVLNAVDQGASVIMTGSDTQALPVIECLSRHRISVPTQVSVTGFDGIGPMASDMVGLTTWQQPVDQLATMAVDFLLDRITSPHLPSRSAHVQGHLIPGRTLNNLV